MAWFLTEPLVPLSKAQSLFPEPMRPTMATLRNYASRGCRGVVLETTGAGRVFTSQQRVVAFLERLAEVRTKRARPEPEKQESIARKLAKERARSICERAGL